MAKKKIEKVKIAKKVAGVSLENGAKCDDVLCPIHGARKLKTRGRVFEGIVINRLPGRVSILFERMAKIPKYERYEKRKTKIHARLPNCISRVSIGDLVLISETRPISKTIHFVVSKVIKSGGGEK
jgi:small subunit ribosomal protein S17